MLEETEAEVQQVQQVEDEVNDNDTSQLSSGSSSHNIEPGSNEIKFITKVVKPLTESFKPQDNITFASNIIKIEHFALISSWINQTKSYKSKVWKIFTPPKNYNITNFQHHFQLLVRGSRDGFTVSTFHRRCDDKGPTITILKVKDTGEILGGYNPFSWESPIESKYYYTTKSFIFSTDYEHPENSILSKAKHHESIKSGMHHGPYFRGDLCFSENFMTGESYHWYYERPIRTEKKFSIDEYEVFQVIKRKEH
ncbi:10199_t:CDS:1 [Cetraspora pellucida]|uniref:10199_t:CDS:1 n=1 Tax=Cetraspora pellucida TaxID=1433469 RepID=A0ACA9KU77_9GLOM|nr:10199_t:CDS:1 [Cetraspora pellucida]